MHAFVLQQISAVKQAAIATSMGVSEATISRLKNEHLELFARVLARAGLKLVPSEYKCYDPRQIDALFLLAREQFNRAKSVDDVLSWDEN